MDFLYTINTVSQVHDVVRGQQIFSSLPVNNYSLNDIMPIHIEAQYVVY